MSETLLHLRATGMRNGPNDYGLIKNNNNTNSLYFPGAPASPPWSISLAQFLRKRLEREAMLILGVPAPSALRTQPHPPAPAQLVASLGKAQQQSSAELRWNALLIYSPRHRPRGVALADLQ